MIKVSNCQSFGFLFKYHRLLILCLLENKGVVQMAKEFGAAYQSEDSVDEHFKSRVSTVAQIVSSLPDKAQMGAAISLSSQYPLHLFYPILCG